MKLRFPKDKTPLKAGIITRSLGGFYNVLLADGTVCECKPRGRLRLAESGLLVGDFVQIDAEQAMIEEKEERKCSFARPKIANVNQAVLILAARDPKPDWFLLDKLLITCAFLQVRPVICFNKWDILTEKMNEEFKSELAGYEQAGFCVLRLSAKENFALGELMQELEGHLSVFTGCSGVGKSSLLNALFPVLELPTGEVSKKLSRGRHTTRHVEIYLFDEALVADTPGFSLLELLPDIKKEQLAAYYPEYRGLALCRFDLCLHDRERQCEVKALIEREPLLLPRYQRYIKLLSELKEREDDLYR